MNKLILDFYGFSGLPFSKDIAIKDIFASTAHTQALGMLTLAAGKEDVVLLSGEIGIGKSVVLRCFLHELDENRFTPVYIRGSSLSPPQLYKYILSGLNITPPYNSSAAKMLFFRKVPELAKKPIVVIDDSQDLPDATFAEIKSLINFDLDSRNCITVVLAGQPETIRRIKMDHLRALRQRIRLSLPMSPMSCEQSVKYIDHHTRICGNNNGIFSEEAKADIFKKSAGVPRTINTICFNTLLHGAAQELHIIDSKDICVPELQDEKPAGRL
jgi:type II secretory pathway predicted ATPase ExeA